MMRRAAAVETVLALLLAFFVAPFQHVHTDSDHPDHAFAGEIHAHFFEAHRQPHTLNHPLDGVSIDDDDDDDHAHVRAIDSVTPVLPHSVPVFVPSRAPAMAAVHTQAQPPVEAVEARANSPPARDQSTPRAPPL